MEQNKQVKMIEEIRTKLTGLVGTRVHVRFNMGRSKVTERDGILAQAHPQLFIVEVEERRGRKARQSYQYVDILTETVELSDPVTGERLFEPFEV